MNLVHYSRFHCIVKERDIEAEVSGMVHKRKMQQLQDVLEDIENPSRTRHQLPTWLQTQDFNEADLPYIHGLLYCSFADWLEDVDGFPWLGGQMLLIHPDGTRISVSGQL